MKEEFNTPINPNDPKYQQWLLDHGKTDDERMDYDIRGAYAEGLTPDERGHLPDTFKKPNHMTFSSESIYSGNGAQGGEWIPGPNNTWTFQASPDNLKYHSPEELEAYFKQYEPDSQLVLPTADSRLKASGY